MRGVRGADSLPRPSSWASPCTCARSLCAGHGGPGTAPPLCPQDPADEEPLNGLDFCSGDLMDAFITACWFSEPRHDLTLSLCPLFMQTAERDSVVPLFIQFSTCVLIPASIPLSLSLLINFLASYNVLLIRATETQMELMLQIIKA